LAFLEKTCWIYQTQQNKSYHSWLQRFYCSPMPCVRLRFKSELPRRPVVKVLFQSQHPRFSIQMDRFHPNKLTVFQSLKEILIQPY
jgi:hypothetical protein